MKNRIYVAAVAVVLLLCVVGFTYQRPQYEYKIEYGADAKKLNRLAGEGWELVAVGAEGSGSTVVPFLVLKRSK